MMKSLLGKMLTEKQYKNLAQTTKQGANFTKSLLLSPIKALIKELSPTSKLRLKSKINVVEKMDYERYNIFLNIDSEMEYKVRVNSCKKEPDTIHWLENFLQEGDVFYDVGANVGVYSFVAAKYFKGKVKVYAFEPAFMNFSQLCKNIHINQFQDSIIPLQIALSDRTTIDTFNYSSLTVGRAQNTLGDAIDEKGKTFNPVFKQYTLSYKIDDLIENFGLPVPNHIKIDVDGIEFLVLKGAAKTLDNSSLRSMIVELAEGERAKEVTNFLSDKGFELHSKYPRITQGLFNYIFQRNSA
ncbi:MAG: FkbM family methyltransferase [Pleurocapsa sp. MO_226.B13]|nr:FkbM family methyltransferase [Pleurocapsa sp. MO_226.B13]